MKHKVKVTVLDTKLYAEYSIALILVRVNVRSITRVMNSHSTVITSVMTTGIAG